MKRNLVVGFLLNFGWTLFSANIPDLNQQLLMIQFIAVHQEVVVEPAIQNVPKKQSHPKKRHYCNIKNNRIDRPQHRQQNMRVHQPRRK